MSEYSGMLSPEDLRSLATGLENANSSAEHLSTLFYEAMKADKKKRTGTRDMSKRASHTPGPWFQMNTADIFTGLGAARADGSKAPSNDGWMIADCDMGGLPLDEVKANARLIRAAPDLLEVAETALLYAVSTGNDLLANMAGQAITKVKGEQHEAL